MQLVPFVMAQSTSGHHHDDRLLWRAAQVGLPLPLHPPIGPATGPASFSYSPFDEFQSAFTKIYSQLLVPLAAGPCLELLRPRLFTPPTAPPDHPTLLFRKPCDQVSPLSIQPPFIQLEM